MKSNGKYEQATQVKTRRQRWRTTANHCKTCHWCQCRQTLQHEHYTLTIKQTNKLTNNAGWNRRTENAIRFCCPEVLWNWRRWCMRQKDIKHRKHSPNPKARKCHLDRDTTKNVLASLTSVERKLIYRKNRSTLSTGNWDVGHREEENWRKRAYLQRKSMQNDLCHGINHNGCLGTCLVWPNARILQINGIFSPIRSFLNLYLNLMGDVLSNPDYQTVWKNNTKSKNDKLPMRFYNQTHADPGEEKLD